MEKLLIQITSGEHNKHCDIRPFGSIHESDGLVDGILRIGTDNLPPKFEYKEVEVQQTKKCTNCENGFPVNWVFIKNGCIRCYEKINHINRDDYREALRAELKLENEDVLNVSFDIKNPDKCKQLFHELEGYLMEHNVIDSESDD